MSLFRTSSFQISWIGRKIFGTRASAYVFPLPTPSATASTDRLNATANRKYLTNVFWVWLLPRSSILQLISFNKDFTTFLTQSLSPIKCSASTHKRAHFASVCDKNKCKHVCRMELIFHKHNNFMCTFCKPNNVSFAK